MVSLGYGGLNAQLGWREIPRTSINHKIDRVAERKPRTMAANQ
jgi:hypothetical protein